MKTTVLLLVSVLLAGSPGAAPGGEIVKRDVYYKETDTTVSQYVFQGDKRRSSRSRSYTRTGLLPRARTVRSYARISYHPRCSYYVPPHCSQPVTYRSRGASVWFYPGGCRSVVRVASPAPRR